MKKIYIGSDHAGFKLKEKLKAWLDSKNILYEDIGAHKLDPKDDYPDYAIALAQKVVAKKARGILLCGSAEGVCIAANKVKGARAVNPSTSKLAKLSREHNDANILCLSGWFNSFRVATRITTVFLNTSFSKERRHKRRVAKIKRFEG